MPQRGQFFRDIICRCLTPAERRCIDRIPVKWQSATMHYNKHVRVFPRKKCACVLRVANHRHDIDPHARKSMEGGRWLAITFSSLIELVLLAPSFPAYGLARCDCLSACRTSLHPAPSFRYPSGIFPSLMRNWDRLYVVSAYRLLMRSSVRETRTV